jgi:glycosyltransferase involved in cell wall biosynthesis
MIVKDESHIVLECLKSVAPYIDYWVICDTGSSDDTKEIIKNFFKEEGIPGELHEVEWKNFGHNRSEALDLCNGKTDYIFMIDADDHLVGNFGWPKVMDQQAYEMRLQRGTLEWWRIQVFQNNGTWMYDGVLHEYPRLKDSAVPQIQKIYSDDYYIEARTLGARNVGQTAIEKYTKDAEMLEEALKEEPNNVRHQFYLAQSYFDSKQWEKSIGAYIKRAQMAGWEEEVYFSLYRIGLCKIMLEKSLEEICMAFLQAWQYRPIRAEPLHELSRFLRVKEQPRLAYLYAKMARNIKFPEWDILFVNKEIYDYAVLDEVASTAFYVHEFDEGLNASRKLLSMKLPDGYNERIKNNIVQYEGARKQYREHLDAMNQKRRLEIENSKVRTKPKTYKKRKKVKR